MLELLLIPDQPKIENAFFIGKPPQVNIDRTINSQINPIASPKVI